MKTSYFATLKIDPMGDCVTHPIELPWRTLAAGRSLAGISLSSSSPLQGAAQSEPEPVLATPWCIGTKGAAALTLASAPHDSPLGRVQLRFLG